MRLYFSVSKAVKKDQSRLRKQNKGGLRLRPRTLYQLDQGKIRHHRHGYRVLLRIVHSAGVARLGRDGGVTQKMTNVAFMHVNRPIVLVTVLVIQKNLYCSIVINKLLK